MDFDKRLDRAIARGQDHRDEKGRELADAEISEEDLRNLHSQSRLSLSERIEECLRKLADHFPGFRYQTVVGDEGWGSRINRDDVDIGAKRRGENLYSRFELLIKPFTTTHIVALTGKGTIRNKELFHRSHYQMLSKVDLDSFGEMIDLWVLEYAEKFASET